MAINLTDAKFGAEPVEKEVYVMGVKSVNARVSKNTGNMYLSVSASILEGPSAGFRINFPNYSFLIYDATGQGRTGEWVIRTRNLMAKIMGIDPQEITTLPSEEGEIVDSMKEMLNATFEAEAEWQDPEGEYPGRWFVGKVVGHVDESTVVPPDWDSFFN